MKLNRVLTLVVAGLLAILLVSLLAGHVLGYPVVLGYVESGSMEPTLNEGDGFIAVPAPLAGDIEVGDVVVFESEHVHGGELTTHRIVEQRQEGYITQGDANPFPDQSMDEPPITEGQVNAVALTANGEVVRIPHLGTAVQAVGAVLDRVERTVAGWFGTPRLGSQQLALLLFGLGLVTFAVAFIGENTERSRSRSRSRPGIDTRAILAVSILLVCSAATLAMVMPAGTETYGIVSSEGNSSNPTIIPTGESDSFEFGLHNGGFVPTVSYLEPQSHGIDIEPDRVRLDRNQTANATVTFHAPDETGYYQRSLTEYRYLAIVPPSVIDGLYHAHPWLPYVLVNTVISIPLVVLWVASGSQNSRIRIRRRRGRTSGLLDTLSRK